MESVLDSVGRNMGPPVPSCTKEAALAQPPSSPLVTLLWLEPPPHTTSLLQQLHWLSVKFQMELLFQSRFLQPFPSISVWSPSCCLYSHNLSPSSSVQPAVSSTCLPAPQLWKSSSAENHYLTLSLPIQDPKQRLQIHIIIVRFVYTCYWPVVGCSQFISFNLHNVDLDWADLLHPPALSCCEIVFDWRIFTKHSPQIVCWSL